ncbi:hypothetical protein [Candidatus Chloroploca asiatica]|uniref:DUF11 domain-containing protein n=1 Tax=Candidatus Chloroploca asiatica TaxID=1506545 RepID=A0A2H3KLX6_9CHLR|nr:hypothetical protein [Candidatus Chloroploca asiatica]PDV98312.1 hypothetical protein A9Q02_16045 [Candidatus Chloroploca asiatica]
MMSLHKRTFTIITMMLLVILTSLNIPSVMAQNKGPGNIAPAQASTRTINGAPLSVSVLNDLAMSVDFDGREQFFEETAGGTFVVVDGVVYGSTPPAGGNFTPRSFTPVSNSPVSGSGTTADPFTITTVVSAGSTGVQITQVTTYVNGTPLYQVDVTARNTSTVQRNVRIFHAADLFLNFPGNRLDYGFGFFDPATGAIGALSQNSLNVQVFIPITAPSAFQEARFATIWAQIGGPNGAAGPGFNNTFDPTFHDVGAGLQFDRTLAAGTSATVSLLGGFGLASDVGVSVPSADTSIPANVWVVNRSTPNHGAPVGSIITSQIVTKNIGDGRARDVRITVPFDPGKVRLLDANFSSNSAWVSSVVTNSLTINTGPVGARGGVITSTLRFQVLETLHSGVALGERLSFTWFDDARGGSGSGNLPILATASSVDNRPTYILNVSPANTGTAGTRFTFASNIFAANEPVGVWYNLPDGTSTREVGTFRANADGSMSVTFNSPGNLEPGAYSMVFYGLWTEFSAVAPFTITR